jgi:hypothetical protein
MRNDWKGIRIWMKTGIRIRIRIGIEREGEGKG